jgi:hypothetical protein
MPEVTFSPTASGSCEGLTSELRRPLSCGSGTPTSLHSRGKRSAASSAVPCGERHEHVTHRTCRARVEQVRGEPVLTAERAPVVRLGVEPCGSAPIVASVAQRDVARGIGRDFISAARAESETRHVHLRQIRVRHGSCHTSGETAAMSGAARQTRSTSAEPRDWQLGRLRSLYRIPASTRFEGGHVGSVRSLCR